jgi:hypothetical protein
VVVVVVVVVLAVVVVVVGRVNPRAVVRPEGLGKW